jgi:hypothetical protein
MSNAASMFTADLDSQHAHDDAHDDADDAFRGRIMAAMRDLRARERRVSSPDLRLGDAANDVATTQFD